MRTILVKGWWPESMGMAPEDATEKNVREFCLRVNRYSNELSCLMSYAECMADWSTILDDSDIDAVNAFCDVAVNHIIHHDFDWLEEHFV